MANQIHSGYIALVGRPNVGKSSLMNTILGQKIAIVSNKVQTTRHKINGIYNYYASPTSDEVTGQIVFVDLPGIHKPLDKLGESCWEASRSGAADANIICMMIEAEKEAPVQLRGGDKWVYEWIVGNILNKNPDKPFYLLINKIDKYTNNQQDNTAYLAKYKELYPAVQEIRLVSAETGYGINELLTEIYPKLPDNHIYYAGDDLTDRSVRWLASELVREAVLTHLSEELPHSVTVEIIEYKEKPTITYINAHILVEHDSQKPIVLGQGGQMIKKISSHARMEIEKLVDGKVYLDLHVRVSANWRSNKAKLKNLGYME